MDNQLNNSVKKKKERMGSSSLLLSLIIVFVIAICFVLSAGSFDEGGSGAIWWLAIFYCWTIEPPLIIASIILGVIGLNEHNKIPSYISLAINAIKILLVVILK